MDLTARLTDDTSEGQRAACGEPPRASLTLGEAWAGTDIHIIVLSSFSNQWLIMGTKPYPRSCEVLPLSKSLGWQFPNLIPAGTLIKGG